MVSFDIITAAGKAYIKLWEERAYLLHLALVPTLIKLTCYTAAMALGYEENILRLSLCLLPAYFAEGWMLSHLVRLIVLGQRWPFRPSGDEEADMPLLRERLRGVMSGTLAYVLINLALAGYLTIMLHFGPQGAAPEDIDPRKALFGFASLVFAFWAVRLIWLYIPLALNMPARDYLKSLGGFSSSLSLIGVWLLCFVPAVAAMLIGQSMILAPFLEGEVPKIVHFSIIFLRVVLDTIKVLLCTAGIAYGLSDLYNNGRKKGGAS
ncbi:MAG: hypothetical protein H6853_00915 [Rhodospirillales bacterium]|nr:hypothetical protein [Alphaproteobacteria bacterium]USO03875.1 MAG: hypothetical protein H6853_00915 [Rhodospirillales bacterium]